MPYSPRKGLSVPAITVVDQAGCVIEADQRKVFRHIAQEGGGADVIFANGTTGEWNGLSNGQRQRLMEIAVDEARTITGVEVWLGLNGSTRAEVRANLDAAIQLEPDAAVIAPLAMTDLDETDIVRFFQRDLNDLIAAAPAPLPVFLYDNAEIAVPGRASHIRARMVKELSRLPWVAGIKVSAPRRVLRNYTRAALHFTQPFGIYVGNAMLVFEGFRDDLEHRHIVGVVAGPANVFPREWQKAWRDCLAGDEPSMRASQESLEQFERICLFSARGGSSRPARTSKTIACMKYALELEGIISSSLVTGVTSALDDEQRDVFRGRYERLRNSVHATSAPSAETDAGRPSRTAGRRTRVRRG